LISKNHRDSWAINIIVQYLLLHDIIDRLHRQTVCFQFKVGINNIVRNNCTIILNDWGSLNIDVIVSLDNSQKETFLYIHSGEPNAFILKWRFVWHLWSNERERSNLASCRATIHPVRNYSSSHRLTPRANVIEISRN